MHNYHIVGFAGSLRELSYNRGLLRAAQKLLPEGLSIEIITLDDLPPYNDDLAKMGIPAGVQKFRENISGADALLIASPEYNYSISGVLKNAIDWCSTNSIGNILDRKIIAVMGASTGNFGTTRGQLHLRQILHAVNARVITRPEVLVRNAAEMFDGNSSVIDKYTQKKIKDLLESLKIFLVRYGRA